MRTLHKKWQLFLYGLGGMGVNMLNLVIGSYLCDALMTEGFKENIEFWTYSNKTLVVAAVWSVMVLIGKIVDGVIDIPLASFADNLRTKWGRRRPAILMGLVLTMGCYVAFLNPITQAENSLGNTIWFGVWLSLFYCFYTLTMGTYYATFAEIVDNEPDRVLLSNFKTVFDIVYFVLGYALIPAMISAKLNIRIIGYIFLPLALTMLIPIFMIKEHSTLKQDMEKLECEQPVNMIKAIKYCFSNKSFMLWMAVYSMLQFGLQMFITGNNVYFSGTMGLQGWQITVIMAAVFAPVPATLILYNKIINKRGLKSGVLFSLATFSASMILMSLCRPEVMPNDTVRLVFAIVSGLLASFGIGCFFSVNYTVPSHLAELQRKQTGASNPTMYFAVQGLFSAVATAISTGLVWVNLRKGGLSWIMPIIVAVSCLAVFGLTFLLPKELNEVGMIGAQPAVAEGDAVPAEAPAETPAETPNEE